LCNFKSDLTETVHPASYYIIGLPTPRKIGKSKVVPRLNQVPHHENVPCA